jgi:hypothetical protein
MTAALWIVGIALFWSFCWLVVCSYIIVMAYLDPKDDEGDEYR